MQITATNTLPHRERETLIGLAAGKTSKEMAREAGISANAINQAVCNLAHRMRLHTTKRTLLVAEAFSRGWISTTSALMLVVLCAQIASGTSLDEARQPLRTLRTVRVVRGRGREFSLDELELLAA